MKTPTPRHSTKKSVFSNLTSSKKTNRTKKSSRKNNTDIMTFDEIFGSKTNREIEDPGTGIIPLQGIMNANDEIPIGVKRTIFKPRSTPKSRRIKRTMKKSSDTKKIKATVGNFK